MAEEVEETGEGAREEEASGAGEYGQDLPG